MKKYLIMFISAVNAIPKQEIHSHDKLRKNEENHKKSNTRLIGGIVLITVAVITAVVCTAAVRDSNKAASKRRRGNIRGRQRDSQENNTDSEGRTNESSPNDAVKTRLQEEVKKIYEGEKAIAKLLNQLSVELNLDLPPSKLTPEQLAQPIDESKLKQELAALSKIEYPKPAIESAKKEFDEFLEKLDPNGFYCGIWNDPEIAKFVTESKLEEYVFHSPYAMIKKLRDDIVALIRCNDLIHRIHISTLEESKKNELKKSYNGLQKALASIRQKLSQRHDLDNGLSYYLNQYLFSLYFNHDSTDQWKSLILCFAVNMESSEKLNISTFDFNSSRCCVEYLQDYAKYMPFFYIKQYANHELSEYKAILKNYKNASFVNADWTAVQFINRIPDNKVDRIEDPLNPVNVIHCDKGMLKKDYDNLAPMFYITACSLCQSASTMIEIHKLYDKFCHDKEAYWPALAVYHKLMAEMPKVSGQCIAIR